MDSCDDTAVRAAAMTYARSNIKRDTRPDAGDKFVRVQEEFHKYLEARGIDATLANYIAEVHVDKEQREYTRWLENVANFVK